MRGSGCQKRILLPGVSEDGLQFIFDGNNAGSVRPMLPVCGRLVQSLELHSWMTMMSCTSHRVGHLVGNDIQRGYHLKTEGASR